MAPHDGAVLEREQDVFANRLYVLEAAAVDSLGDAEKRRARMRRVGAHDVSLQHAKALRGAMDCVSLGHGRLAA
jgi:hypothetical protein